jgi:hypothetical protein
MYSIRHNLAGHVSLALVACAALIVPVPAPGQTEPARAAKPPESPRPKDLTVSPRAAPIPALKYRLLPSATELNPGDAAPIYLRIHGYEDQGLQEQWSQIRDKTARWMALPLKEFPTSEARAFVNVWRGKLKQLEFGTRRRTCDWNYTLPEERLDAVGILLPDAQSMSEWGRVLALKARVEVAEGKLDDAIRTIETGLAFARHLGSGPFVINGLVGIALANLVLELCDDLISQPGAPNLYWALSALPRPLIDLRNQLEVEESIGENLIPELTETELNKPRTPADWASLLWRMHERIVKWGRLLASESSNAAPDLRNLAGWSLEQLKAEVLPVAKKYLDTSHEQSPTQRPAMCDDQIVALYMAGRYRELRDDLFKASYLPAHEALPQVTAAGKRLETVKSPTLALFVAIYAGDSPLRYGRPLSSELWLDRRIATLRVIEAIRLYAAAHDGALPEALEQVTDVPVPNDPATGKPFIYRRAGSAAILHGPQAGLRAPWTPYRITIRPGH